MKTKKKKLTPQQERACQKFLECSNKTEAYKSAYDTSRMKDTTANRLAHRLFDQDNVQARVEELLEKRMKKLDIKADYVLKRLIEIDTLDVAEILNDDGSLKPISKWTEVWRKSVSAVDLQTIKSGDIETIVRKVKIPDKLRNLELIGKHIDVKAWQEDEKKDEEESPQVLKIEYSVRESENPVSVTIGKKKHGS